MRIGFIGLGIMGAPMARHLVAAGHEVVGHNRSAPAVEAFVAAGGLAAAPDELAATSDALVLVLPDGPDVEAVLFGDGSVDPGGTAADGVADHLRPGTLVVDCSTIAPETARSAAARLGRRGVRYVDAPVSGGESGAVAGTLAVMMGGTADDVAAAEEVVAPFAGSTAHVGPVGSGQLVKAANQVLVAGNIAVLAEALSLLRRTGVDLDAALAVLGGGLAASRVLELKAPKMLAGDLAPGFRLDLHHKDLKIALGAAERAGVGLPLTGTVTQLVLGLRAAGDGSLDHAALVRAIERLSGLPVTGGAVGPSGAPHGTPGRG
ncbi:2-hydroxy-3-oxopropionate reductase [Desertihabitans brevis]|uniref:2-hydroxy-3-oxopropionate reductase n=1 Tax=Desertihabitans brevis TaxID=2268447 RepID=A0A367YZN9_9ACTN|nr:NAD(P)-binding domain-containing protein [Desertihabitans brevis]RCK71330.1 2-hydroxy-3-oxopropionate reductase [Desertihabitans brevis]